MKIRKIAEKTAKIIGCTAVLAFFSALSADKVAAEDIGAEVSVGYDTDYMFRGVNLGEDLLWSDVNVSTTLTDGLDLGVGAWYANVADDAGNDELDIYAGLSTSMGDISLDLGATYYYYPDPVAGEGTLEFGVGFGTSAGPFSAGPITPTGVARFRVRGFEITSISLSKNPGDLNVCSAIILCS